MPSPGQFSALMADKSRTDAQALSTAIEFLDFLRDQELNSIENLPDVVEDFLRTVEMYRPQLLRPVINGFMSPLDCVGRRPNP